MMQSLPPPTTFSVPAQAPPPSLLQAQLSAASLAPLLQNPPQPLLPQPPSKGTVMVRLFWAEKKPKTKHTLAHIMYTLRQRLTKSIILYLESRPVTQK